MTRSTVDPCLYTREDEHGGRLLIIVWVDDLCVASSTQIMFDEFFAAFKIAFNSTTTKMERFVGIEIIRNIEQKTLTIKQTKYIEKIAKRFLSLPNTKEWKTPTATSREEIQKFMAITCAQTDDERSAMIGKDFLALMGALLYASCMTRPDISFHCGYLCQFMQDPSPQAYDAGLGVLSYLLTTKDLGITYGGMERACAEPEATTKTGIIIHADSSFGTSPSPFGGGFIEWNNGAIAWVARKAKMVPDSTCKGELSAINTMMNEGIFANAAAQDMFVKLTVPHLITDASSAFDIIKNPGVTKRSATFERWLHYARDKYLHNQVKVFLTKTSTMMADDKTKALDRDKFLKCRAYQMNTG
jgi:hypothetical protein